MQVAASTNKEVDAHIPNYPNLSPQLICQLHNVTMHVSMIHFASALSLFVGSYDFFSYVINRQMWRQMKYMLKWPFSHWVRYIILLCLVLWVHLTFSMWHYFPFSKSKRMYTYYLQNWVLPASSQPIIFVKHWLQVILALMEDSLFLAVQLKKSFHLL